jgi:hypothetical protein
VLLSAHKELLTPTARYGTYSTVHTALLLSEDVHTKSSNACGVTGREGRVQLAVAGASGCCIQYLTVLHAGAVCILLYIHDKSEAADRYGAEYCTPGSDDVRRCPWW